MKEKEKNKIYFQKPNLILLIFKYFIRFEKNHIQIFQR